MYCMQLLEQRIVVPGSGFGQVPGTLYLQTTILPQEEAQVTTSIADFHNAFLAKCA
jgi:aspartate/methionine/tyrosine aminotransferase